MLFVVPLTVMCVLSAPFLLGYFDSGYPAGWDASTHFAVSLLYSRDGWPSLQWRTEQWFQGFEFPRYYPPLFFLLAGGLYKVLPGYETEVFKVLVVGPILLLPSLISLLYAGLGGRKLFALFAGITSALFLSTSESMSYFSVGLWPAAGIGLVTQGLASVLLVALLLCSVFFLRGSWIFGVFVAFLAAPFLLSNFHVVLVGTSLIGGIILLNSREQLQRSVILSLLFLFGAILSAPWYWAVATSAAMIPSIPMNPLTGSPSVFSLSTLLFASIIPVLVFEGAVKRGILQFLLVLTALTILSYAPVADFGIRLPWQPHRLFAIVAIFVPIALAAGIEGMWHGLGPLLTSEQKRKLRFSLLLLGSTVLFFFTPYISIYASLDKKEQAQLSELITWLTENPVEGYTLVPLMTSPQSLETPIELALTNYIALAPSTRSLWNMFRESSFNTMFTATLRNTISHQFESWGTPHTLSRDEIRRGTLEERLARLPQWGVSRLIVHSPGSVDFENILRLSSSPLKREFKNELATVFTFHEVPTVQIDFQEAVLLVTDTIQFPPRPNFLDAARLAETLAIKEVTIPPIIIFQSCDEIYSLNASPGGRIFPVCTEKAPCCKKIIESDDQFFADMYDLKSTIAGRILNKTPSGDNRIFAAPFREVAFNKPFNDQPA